MEIVKEMSRMLNFTYKLYDAQAISNDDQIGQNETVSYSKSFLTMRAF